MFEFVLPIVIAGYFGLLIFSFVLRQGRTLESDL